MLRPGPYGYGQAYAQHYGPRDPMQVMRVPPHVYARGKQLVFWSRMLLLAGLVVGFAGCGSLAALPQRAAGPAFGIGLLLACVTVIAAAVVGTIGRRLQGRIV
jgi:hypothetical protein